MVTTPAEDLLIYDWSTAEGEAPAKPRLAMLDDETLRDGLQSPSVRDPSVDEKIEIIHLIDRLGIETVFGCHVAVFFGHR